MTDPLAGEPPKLSVVSITYNQEAFIRETLDGFVAQKTAFPVEVIIADDASTDATPGIIQDYADRHPDLFRPILRSENIGVHANFAKTLSAARGEYIALCEGDDFWTDPLKLTKQVEFLDQHPKTTVCFHPVRVVYDDGTKDEEFPPNSWRHDLSVEALLWRNFIQTNSVVYRRLPRYEDLPPGIMPIDWYLHVRHAVHGEIAMLPDTMAVYRRHAQGIWYTAHSDRQKFWAAQGHRVAATLEAMLDLFPGNQEREGIVGAVADGILGQIASLPSTEGRAVLLDTIAQNPRMTMLSLQHRWSQTPRHQLKLALANEVSTWIAQGTGLSARIKGRIKRRRVEAPDAH